MLRPAGSRRPLGQVERRALAAKEAIESGPNEPTINAAKCSIRAHYNFLANSIF